MVALKKLRQFQEMGHQVVLIVGDWTAQIGDPSGESQTRPMLSRQQVLANAQTYLKQFFKVVDEERTEVRWQSEWFGKFTLADVFSLGSKFTVAQLMAREDFAKRQAAGRPIAIIELLYPLLQAYDSVVIAADVEFGGIDQKFNCLMGRELQQMMGQRPQQVFLMPLLIGTDGKLKMSKSLGNYIAIQDEPNEMYGKTMSIPDELLLDYFELLTDLADEELEEFREALAQGSVNPMELKKRLAREIVAQFHSKEAAEDAEAEFEKVFQRRGVPEEIIEYPVSFSSPPKGLRAKLTVTTPSGQSQERLLIIDLSEVLIDAKVVDSRSEVKRLIKQRAIEIGYEKIGSPFYALRDGDVIKVEEAKVEIRDGSIIKVGKRRFVRLVDADRKRDS
jgi:tyrosyl-tRNA synthetase